VQQRSAATATDGGVLSRCLWRVCAALFVIVLGAAEEVTQPLESVASRLIRHLRVDLHRHGDPAVPKNRHRDARVNFERGEQRAARAESAGGGSP